MSGPWKQRIFSPSTNFPPLPEAAADADALTGVSSFLAGVLMCDLEADLAEAEEDGADLGGFATGVEVFEERVDDMLMASHLING